MPELDYEPRGPEKRPWWRFTWVEVIVILLILAVLVAILPVLHRLVRSDW